MKKKYFVLLMAIIILAVICVTAGVTYAIFNYYKEGKVDNVITSGKITFRYDEDSVNGIDLQNALPMKNYKGSELSGEGQVFDFTISSEGTDEVLEYSITLETTEDSTLDPSIVNTYLTIVDEEGNETTPCWYSPDIITTVDNFSGHGYIPEISEPIEIKYRLRIWIDDEVDFSPLKNEDGTYQEDENGNYIYPYNNQTFKVRVNVSSSVGFKGENLCTYSPSTESQQCVKDSCFIGGSLTLSDNSTWKVLTQDQSTVTLIYDHYIDQDGNYDIEEKSTYSCGTNPLCDEKLIDVNTVLNNFSNKIKVSLEDENVVVGLPSAEMLGITLQENYFDAYFLAKGYNRLSNMKSYYILSDYDTYAYGSYDSDQLVEVKKFYIVGNGKVASSASYIIGGKYMPINVGIKPIITISKDYIPSGE